MVEPSNLCLNTVLYVAIYGMKCSTYSPLMKKVSKKMQWLFFVLFDQLVFLVWFREFSLFIDSAQGASTETEQTSTFVEREQFATAWWGVKRFKKNYFSCSSQLDDHVSLSERSSTEIISRQWEDFKMPFFSNILSSMLFLDGKYSITWQHRHSSLSFDPSSRLAILEGIVNGTFLI